MLSPTSKLLSLDARYVLRCATWPAPEAVLPLAYEPYLYLRPEHLALQCAPSEVLFFYLEDQELSQTVGQWPLVLVDGQVHRPWQVPFGGVQLALAIPEAVAQAFVRAVHQEVVARGVQQVHVRSYPASYAPELSDALTQTFQSLGYRVVLTEINMTLPLQQSFEAGLHPSEQRRLRKCQRHGLRVEQETPLFLPLAYEFIQRCRAEKGQHLSLSLERLQESFREFPNDYFLFSVRDAAGEWAAMTVLLRVNDQVLYNFCPASPLAYNTFSPVVLLTQGLHAFGQASGFRLLDLGTSTFPDGPNESLLRFKRHLGGVPGPRLTWEFK